MSRYARNTTVEIGASVAEIERVVIRYGAESFQYGWQGDAGYVGFTFQGFAIRLVVPMPSRDAEEFTRTPTTGKQRTESAAVKAWEQAKRQRWRALLVAVTAKLEVVESGIREFAQEFGMDVVLPTGRTVGETILPQLAQGKTPLLLEAGK